MKNLLRRLTCKHTYMVKAVFDSYNGTSKTITILECPHCKKRKKNISSNKIKMKNDIVA